MLVTWLVCATLVACGVFVVACRKFEFDCKVLELEVDC